jgi:hypothetical protein
VVTYLFIIVHLIVVAAFSMALDRRGFSKKFSMFLGFVLAGILFGAITYFIDSYQARVIINPVGARIADWLHDNWDPAYKRPEQFTREPVIPWLLSYPQTYLFTTTWVYAIIGAFSWIAGVINAVDPTRRYQRSSVEDDVAYQEPEPKSNPDLPPKE